MLIATLFAHVANAIPLQVVSPSLMPVNEPGPTQQAIFCISFILLPLSVNTSTIMFFIATTFSCIYFAIII